MKTVAKSRILVTRFPYSSQWGGEELHTLTLARELDERGIPSFFLGSCPMLSKAFKEAYFDVQNAWFGKPPVTKVWLMVFTVLSPFLFLKAGWMLKNARKKWRVDTVLMLSFGEKLLMTPWAHFFGMKVLWVEHARIGRWLTKNPWRLVYRAVSPRARVVVTSKAMVAHVAPWVAEGQKVHAISCGVMRAKPTPLREELSRFLTSGFGVLCVARLTTDKGVDMLVHCVQSKPDVRLILVGDGPLLPELKKTLEKTSDPERIRIVPSLPRGELMELYRTADLFVLPSREMDPFGMVVAEAMSFGTPVMVSSECGISQDLHHGREAWIVDPRLAEIDKGLKRLMKDSALRAELGKSGQAFVKHHYALQGMVDGFERLLNR
jgi:glycosyltransferase involved in cell wall biosynthesis